MNEYIITKSGKISNCFRQKNANIKKLRFINYEIKLPIGISAAVALFAFSGKYHNLLNSSSIEKSAG